MTFGAGYICIAFGCGETCRDEPFSAARRLSTEGDADIEHGGVSSMRKVLLMGSFRSGTMNGTPAEMTASNGFISSRVLFFTSTGEPPRCTTLDRCGCLTCVHLVRMRNAAVELDRALSIKRSATFMSVLSLGVKKKGFTQPLGPLS